MLIETLRLMDDKCEGYAIRINGKIAFEYFTQYDALEDANLIHGHQDVLSLGTLLYTLVAAMDGQGDANIIHHTTENREEYFNFTKGDQA